jgi:hypothetical protein
MVGDLCLIKVRGAAMTAMDLTGVDWRREFAPDHPQTSLTIRAQAQVIHQRVRSRAELGDAKAQKDTRLAGGLRSCGRRTIDLQTSGERNSCADYGADHGKRAEAGRKQEIYLGEVEPVSQGRPGAMVSAI